MSLFAPRELEPYSKKELLEKREQRLRHDLSATCTETTLRKSAEKVRAAQLSILKAQHELLRYRPSSEELACQLTNIEKSNEVWLEMPVDDIINMYRTSRP